MSPPAEAPTAPLAPASARNWRGRATSFSNLALLLFGGFFLLLGWQSSCYERGGQVVEAHVLRKYKKKSSQSKRRNHIVEYRFTTRDGEAVTGHSQVLPDLWSSVEAGSPVSVEYLPDVPSTNRVAGQVTGSGVWLPAGAVLLAIAAFRVLRPERAPPGQEADS
jgi:hypothetical protein